MKLAIFDVDKTITAKDTFFRFFLFLLRKYPIRIFRIVDLPFVFLLTRLLRFDRLLVKKGVLRLLTGTEISQIEGLMEQFVTEVVISLCRKEALERIRQLQESGHFVLLCSASPDVYIKAFAKKLGVEGVGTPCAVKDGRLIINGKHCYGSEKIRYVEEYCKNKSLIAMFSDSYFFTDHYSDLPLLSKVGFPVAVWPDMALKKEALEKNWLIEYWS